ncbi:hypothetical protein C8T65DRAFT_744535 [Cerioporus squamosus]|nr:hypothetical protein C8T65DRAFT_744535 [Cerioporus squamosus]
MAAKLCQFRCPILVAPSPPLSPADSASDSPITTKYRYLTEFYFDYPVNQRVHVSDLKDEIFNVIRKFAEYADRPDSDYEVRIYECLQLPVPSAHTAFSKRKAYEAINDHWLKLHGLRVAFDRRAVASLKGIVCFAFLLSTILALNATPFHEFRIERVAMADPPRTNRCRRAKARVAINWSSPPTADEDSDHFAHRRSVQRPPSRSDGPAHLHLPSRIRHFKYMQETRVFTPEELDTAHDFVTQAVTYYMHEGKRQEKLSLSMSKGVHHDILESTPISNSTGSFTADGAVFAGTGTRDGFTPLIGAHELQADIGEGGCDPSAQAENVYVAYYSSNEARSVRERCCCPAFLIGSAVPNLQVSGAVFADQLIVQNLGDTISVVPRLNLNGRSSLDNAGHRVAQLFYALRMCLNELDEYYTHLIHSMAVPNPPHSGNVGVMPGRSARPSTGAARTSQPAPMVISPHFKTYEDEQGKAVILTYKRRLATEYPSKAVFVAEAKCDTETVDVVVKFTPAYGKAAHELLASASPSQAPKLRFCEFVDSDPAHIASLESAVTALHDHGFVFGDLRTPNVLLVGDRVVLIDFDWCDKEGTARYPSDILLEEGTWHAGVKRGGLMEQVHDGYHFLTLTGKTLPTV